MVTPPCGKRLEIGLEFVLSLVVGIHEQLELLAVEMVAQNQREAADRVAAEIRGQKADSNRTVGAEVVVAEAARLAKRIGVPGRPLPVQPSQRSGILVGRVVKCLQRDAARRLAGRT